MIPYSQTTTNPIGIMVTIAYLNDLKMIKKGYMGVGLHYFLGMKDNNDVKEFISRLKHYKKTEF